MWLITNDVAVLCKAFLSTLSDKVLTWFTSLRPNSIDSWSNFGKLFLDKFSTAGTLPKKRGDLANIKPRQDESLLSYLGQFKKTYEEIEGLSQDTVITCFEGGFRSKTLFTKLQLRKSTLIDAISTWLFRSPWLKKVSTILQHEEKKRQRSSSPRQSRPNKTSKERRRRIRGQRNSASPSTYPRKP